MATGAIVSLVIVVSIVGLIVLGLLTWAAVGARQATNASSVHALPACNAVDPSLLIQIDPVAQYCSQSTSITGQLYYIGCVGGAGGTGGTGGAGGDFVVSAVESQPLAVCGSYCSTPPTDGVCTGPDYKGRSAQENFDDCMGILSPTGCTGAIPLAANGTTLYYAYSATCEVCGSCVCNCYNCTACAAVCDPDHCENACGSG